MSKTLPKGGGGDSKKGGKERLVLPCTVTAITTKDPSLPLLYLHDNPVRYASLREEDEWPKVNPGKFTEEGRI